MVQDGRDVCLQIAGDGHAVAAETEHHRHVDDAELAAQEGAAAGRLLQAASDLEHPLDFPCGVRRQRPRLIAKVEAKGHLRAQMGESGMHLGGGGAGQRAHPRVGGPCHMCIGLAGTRTTAMPSASSPAAPPTSRAGATR